MSLKTKNIENKTYKRIKYEPITIKEPHKYDVKSFEDPQEFTEYYREHEDEIKGVSTLVLNRTYKIPGYRISFSNRGKEDEELILRKDYYGATYFTKLYIDNARDVVVRGEPEYTALEWTNAVRDGIAWNEIKGLSYLQDDKLTHNPPRQATKSFDDLPFPARHHLAKREFHNPKLKIAPYTTMITSRNCPFKCIYCVPSSLSFARELEYRSEHNR